MTLLGGITIGYIRRGPRKAAMIGYWMGEAHAGQGHMFAALQFLVIPSTSSQASSCTVSKQPVFQTTLGASACLKKLVFAGRLSGADT